MSYILDALKRSEAERERERGTAPSLHGQAHLVIDPAEDEVPVVPPMKAGRLVGLGLLLAAVLAGLGWWLWSPAPQPAPALARAAPPVVAASPPAASAPVAAVAPMPVTVPPPLPADASPSPQPQPGQVPSLVSAPPDLGKATPPPVMALGPSPGGAAAPPPAAVPGAAPLPALREAPGVASPPPSAVPAPTPAPTPPRPLVSPDPQPPREVNGAGAVEALPAPVATKAKPLTPRLSELPADLRRQLPPLKISGSVYSPDVPARMLILDGQILREGQNAGPELLIEQIGPKAAVLSFRGQRFELPYGP